MDHRFVEDDRILRAMPFSFYLQPYLVTTLRHYEPAGYYERLIGLFAHASSPAMLRRRLHSASLRRITLLHRARTARMRASLGAYRRIHRMLLTDSRFRLFHEGHGEALPDFYHHEYERMLGPYAGMLSRADRVPARAGPPRRRPERPRPSADLRGRSRARRRSAAPGGMPFTSQASPVASRPRITSALRSGWRQPMPWYAAEGNAWWLLCQPSPSDQSATPSCCGSGRGWRTGGGRRRGRWS